MAYLASWGIFIEDEEGLTPYEVAVKARAIVEGDKDKDIWHISNLDTMESTIIDFSKPRILERNRLREEAEKKKKSGDPAITDTMTPLDRLRALLPAVDPAALTGSDKRALTDLLAAAAVPGETKNSDFGVGFGLSSWLLPD